MGYLANFMVYTFAMIGVIAIALLAFKNSTNLAGGAKSKYLKIIDSLSISPRKRLYIISTGKENFLIAGDVDKTTLISKLDSSNLLNENCNLDTRSVHSAINENSKMSSFKSDFSSSSINYNSSNEKSFKDTMASLPQNHFAKSRFMDNGMGINSSILTNNTDNAYTSVIKSLATKMRQ